MEWLQGAYTCRQMYMRERQCLDLETLMLLREEQDEVITCTCRYNLISVILKEDNCCVDTCYPYLSHWQSPSLSWEKLRSLQNNFQKRRSLWNCSASPPAKVKQFQSWRRQTPSSFCGFGAVGLTAWLLGQSRARWGTQGSLGCSIIGGLRGAASWRCRMQNAEARRGQSHSWSSFILAHLFISFS